MTPTELPPREIPPTDRAGKLSSFSLRRPITIFVLFMSAVVIGSIATSRVPVELFPAGFEAPFLSVSVPWQDAPAREVLDKVSIPLEEELNTVRGIDRVITVASLGNAGAYLFFKQGADMDVAYREVRDRVERARALFPDDIDRVFINTHGPSGIPVYALGVAVDAEVSDSYNLIQNEIVRALERVDGVASVEAQGLLEKEILIELDRDRTNAAGLNIYDLAMDLGSDNFTMASGNVRDSGRKLALRSVARFESLEALENRIVGNQDTRLKDIATIRYEEPEKDFRVRAMSKPATAIMVMAEGDANVRELTGRLDEVQESLNANPRLAAAEMITLFSQGDVIDEALSTLLSSGLIGGLIAAVVLFLFLRRLRMTVIVALGIPLSLLIGLTVMYFGGESLNILTLLGLMLCVGLLVDNSVVVAENIYRLYRNGVRRREACVRGASEVGLAITMSTMTTVVVFAPAALVVEGPAQFFLLRLAIPVCVSVVASLVVALIFIPLAVFVTLGSETFQEKPRGGRASRFYESLRGWIRRAYEATFGRLNAAYVRVLRLFVHRRLELVLLTLALFGTVIPIMGSKTVTFVGQQEEERGGFEIDVEMPRTASLEETEAWFLEAERIVEESAEELGLEGWFLYHEKTYGELQGWFKSPRTTKLSPAEVTEIVKDRLPLKPGMELFVGGESETNVETKSNIYPIVLHGDDPELLESAADLIKPILLRVDGVLGVKSSRAEAPNELALVIDRERAQRYGTNPEAIAGVVGYALRGTPLPKYRDGGKEIPVRVRFQESDRESLDELQNFYVPTMAGDFLPVSALTSTRQLEVPRTIVRRDARVSESIVLELESGEEKQARQQLDRLVATLNLPEGVTFGANESRQRSDEDLAAIMSALLFSVILIYLLMGFLFESVILPLSIIFTIPLSFVGVVWIHAATGYDLDFLGAIAVIVLVGVVVNNGIVLIDYVNRLRAQGHSRDEALLTATDRRFRPIMMTAITTIGGMVPLALAGANSIGISYTSFSLSLIGGMATGTLLTLLVVPVLYSLFDDARVTLGRAIGSVLGNNPVLGRLGQARR